MPAGLTASSKKMVLQSPDTWDFCERMRRFRIWAPPLNFLAHGKPGCEMTAPLGSPEGHALPLDSPKSRCWLTGTGATGRQDEAFGFGIFKKPPSGAGFMFPAGMFVPEACHALRKPRVHPGQVMEQPRSTRDSELTCSPYQKSGLRSGKETHAARELFCIGEVSGCLGRLHRE